MSALLIRFYKDRSGAAAAEMALILPLALIVMFVSFEAANYIYTEQKIIKAVRQGARYAGRLPFNQYTCPSAIDAGSVTSIKTVTLTGSPTGTDSLIGGWEVGDINVTMACNGATVTGIFEGNTGGAPVVTVSATADYISLFPGMADVNFAQVRASAQATVNGI